MKKSGVFYLFLSAFILGMGISVPVSVHGNDYSNFIDNRVFFTAVVAEQPKQTQYGYELTILPYAQKQKMLLKTGKQNFEYGDKLFVFGYPRTILNNSDFNYADFLRAQNIYAQINSSQVFIIQKNSANRIVYFTLKVKEALTQKILKYLPSATAGILIAFTFGDKEHLTALDQDVFAHTGTIHLIAVSGYKLTLVIIALEALRKYIGKYSLILSIAFTFVYLVFTSFAPPVCRAAIMSFVYVFCDFGGRRYNRLAILITLAALMILQNPFVIYDIGFLLSFVGILGIILLMPFLKKCLYKIPESFFKETFIASLSAQIATIPLTIFYFQQLSILSALNNALMLPFLAPIIICTYLIQLPFIGLLAAYLSGAAAKIMFYILSFSAQLPGFFQPKITQIQMLSIYVSEIIIYLMILVIQSRPNAIEKVPSI